MIQSSALRCMLGRLLQILVSAIMDTEKRGKIYEVFFILLINHGVF